MLVLPSLHQMTPLHVATKHGRVETVRYLVDRRARIDIKNMHGVCRTPDLRMS